MTPPCLFFDGAMLGHLRSLVEGNGLFCVRSGVDKAPSCELTPGRPSPPPCQLHRATRLRSHPSHFASTAPFHSPPPQSIKMRRCISTPTTAQVCRFTQTEQSSDLFITWAARIILRHRSFLLSINMVAYSGEMEYSYFDYNMLFANYEILCEATK